jgi:hypothetical protein
MLRVAHCPPFHPAQLAKVEYLIHASREENRRMAIEEFAADPTLLA